ncbi:uncharacterized protein LACBIDRAFT_332987 [Laccaria bicolor S238N-H82]|uniref:Predicted protein n=1 Tax=Laccaria bicolor (strain S238N-H82 / ATCC MYA-4686) TaxID=486041 RepID=B0DUG4_LACBS|nr:uncharacterized protein LACBIDRAFT_332987 [Laccaria bicolor S238N-H82]EDR01735.1 predicted protein [Laccaria bicolor S238N-H82]|eukprot:XP_001887548.1 predicted protein [Laccaria bicolor S238N-H82]
MVLGAKGYSLYHAFQWSCALAKALKPAKTELLYYIIESSTLTSTVVKPFVSRFAGLMKLSSTLLQAANRQVVPTIDQHNRAVLLSRDSARRIREAFLHDNSPDARRKVGQILQNIRTQPPIPDSSFQPLRLPMHTTTHGLLRLGDLQAARRMLQTMMERDYRVRSRSADTAFSMFIDHAQTNLFWHHEFRNNPAWKPPKPRNTHLWTAVLYMQFIREFSPDLHYSLLREIIFKKYLVLAARVLYDVVNDQKKVDQRDAELYLELGQTARRLCAAPLKSKQIMGAYTFAILASVLKLEAGKEALGKYANVIAGMFHATHPREDTAAYCRFALESFMSDISGSDSEPEH